MRSSASPRAKHVGQSHCNNEEIHQLNLKNRNNATQNYNSQQPFSVYVASQGSFIQKHGFHITAMLLMTLNSISHSILMIRA